MTSRKTTKVMRNSLFLWTIAWNFRFFASYPRRPVVRTCILSPWIPHTDGWCEHPANLMKPCSILIIKEPQVFYIVLQWFEGLSLNLVVLWTKNSEMYSTSCTQEEIFRVCPVEGLKLEIPPSLKTRSSSFPPSQMPSRQPRFNSDLFKDVCGVLLGRSDQHHIERDNKLRRAITLCGFGFSHFY